MHKTLTTFREGSLGGRPCLHLYRPQRYPLTTGTPLKARNLGGYWLVHCPSPRPHTCFSCTRSRRCRRTRTFNARASSTWAQRAVNDRFLSGATLLPCRLSRSRSRRFCLQPLTRRHPHPTLLPDHGYQDLNTKIRYWYPLTVRG